MALSHNQRRRNNYDHDFDGEDSGFIAQFRNKGKLANESIYEVIAEHLDGLEECDSDVFMYDEDEVDIVEEGLCSYL